MSDITDLLEPDERAALADGPLYKNVGSEVCRGCSTSTEPHAAWGEAGAPAPPEWALLAELCPTCKGIGCDLSPESIMRTFGKRMDGAPAGSVGVDPCPDCHEGKPVHTITVPCPVDCSPADHLFQGGARCSVCGGTSTVSVRVTVRLVPVVDGWSNVVAPECIVIADGKTWWCLGDNAWERGANEVAVSGPPLSPGDWVAVITKVETTDEPDGLYLVNEDGTETLVEATDD